MLRKIKNLYQRCRYGFCDQDLIDLDLHLSKIIYSRLIRFNKLQKSHKGNLSSKEGKKVILKMIRSFKIMSKGKEPLERFQYNKQVINEGLDLFRKHFKDLWI